MATAMSFARAGSQYDGRRQSHRGMNMERSASADGTVIAYEQWGSGPLVMIVGGAFNDRRTWAASTS